MPDTGAPASIHITVLGSGTSVGVPTIGCHCAVCSSTDPRDQRLRPSIAVRWNGHTVLVDTTPDFRTQALRARLERLDAILFTHSHADHIMGLDDIRPFNFRQSGPIPIYGSEATLAAIRRTFAYIFEDRVHDSHVPKLRLETIEPTQPVTIHGLDFLPVPVHHGTGSVLGFRFASAAYLTDHSDIPEESLALLENLDVLFLDALRYKPHPTHSTVQKSLQYVERLKPRRTFFTHICHDLGHQRAESLLPPHVRLAYDGLEIALDGCAPQ
ncbi:MAG: MBL fold metallo-hydrolase [Bryobacteraceae bacterium]|nr:MBL fold metallo-hydrolase [Bryobacteraceae bacterium]